MSLLKGNGFILKQVQQLLLDKKIVPLCFAGLSAGALPSPLNYIRRQAIDSDDADTIKAALRDFFKGNRRI